MWLFIRDDQLTVRTLVNVIVLALAWCDLSESKKKGETEYKIQNRNSPRVSDLLVYSSMVSFNV
jgi:hypothetical protein